MVNTTLINLTTTLANGNDTILLNASSPSKLVSFLHTLANPTLLMFALPVLLVAAILIFVIKNVTPVSHFLYANSRIQARSNYMVNDSLLLNLVEASQSKNLSSIKEEIKTIEEAIKQYDNNFSFTGITSFKNLNKTVYSLKSFCLHLFEDKF